MNKPPLTPDYRDNILTAFRYHQTVFKKPKLTFMKNTTTVKPTSTKPRGFAAMSAKKQREIASMGGQTIAKRKGYMSKLGKRGGGKSHGGRRDTCAEEAYHSTVGTASRRTKAKR